MSDFGAGFVTAGLIAIIFIFGAWLGSASEEGKLNRECKSYGKSEISEYKLTCTKNKGE